MKKMLFMLFALMMIAAAGTVNAQSLTRDIKGANGFVKVSNDGGASWQLQNDGKIVGAKYTDIHSGDGKSFAVKASNGKFGVIDANGNVIKAITYYSASVSAGYMTLKKEQGGEYEVYNSSAPYQKKEATTLSQRDINAIKGYSRTMKQVQQDDAIEKAKELSAKSPQGAYELRLNKSDKLELYVKGEKLLEAAQFEVIESEPFEDSNCWFFIMTDFVNGKNRQAVAYVWIEGGEIEAKVTINYGYDEILDIGGFRVKCRSNMGNWTIYTYSGKKI